MPADERSSFRRFLWWDYRRAGWQYDVFVGLILAFIFLTPREWFRDQPRTSSVVALSADQFWIEPELLAEIPEAEISQHAVQLLKTRTGRKYTLVRLEPIFNSEREIKGYMAFTKH